MATGETTNNKITWKGEGKSPLERIFSGKTISEIKSMTTEERNSYLSLKNKKELNTGDTQSKTIKWLEGVNSENFKESLEKLMNEKKSVKFDINSFSGSTSKEKPTHKQIPHIKGKSVSSGSTKQTNFKSSSSTIYDIVFTGNTKIPAKISMPSKIGGPEKFVSGTIDDSFVSGNGYGFDGDVYSIAIQSDGKILVGGDFYEYYSPNWSGGYIAPYLIRLNPDGDVDDTFSTNNLNGDVNAIYVLPDGKILLGGNFNDYDGDTYNYFIKLNSDGSPDTSFYLGDGFSNTVLTIDVQTDGKILVGGYFYNYNSVTTPYLARLNSNGSLDSSFLYNELYFLGGTSYALKIQSDGKIIVGGNFSFIGINGGGPSINVGRIARFNSDGTLDTEFYTGQGFNGDPYAIDIQSDGKIIVGGEFDNYNGTDCGYIVRLNTDGTLNSTFGWGLNDYVYSIKVQPDDKIIVGGDFGSVYPQFNNGYSFNADELVRFHADTTFDYGFYYSELFNSGVYAIALDSNNRILVGGGFYESEPEFPLAHFGKLFNTITKYKYVYNVINYDYSDGTLVKNYSVGSNIKLTYENDSFKYVSFKSLQNPSSIGVGQVIVEESYPLPYGEPDYELIKVYDSSYSTSDVYLENFKYVSAYSMLKDEYNTIYIFVDKKYEIGDIFFINTEYYNDGDGYGVRSCFKITEEISYDTPFFEPAPYSPYTTCEECVQSNGVPYTIGIPPIFAQNIISYQYFNTLDEEYPTILLPISGILGEFPGVVFNSDAYYEINDYNFVPTIYSTKVYNDYPYDGGYENFISALYDKGLGNLDLSFNGEYQEGDRGFNDWVFDTKVQPDGKIIVGGLFDYYNGIELPGGEGIARLNQDGTLDTTFTLPYISYREIYDTHTLSDGSVLLGGSMDITNIFEDFSWSYESNGDGSTTYYFPNYEITGTNDSSSPGWTYIYTQMSEKGTITFNYYYNTIDEECCDWAFYYVGKDEPSGDVNIDFELNNFAINNNSNGKITINYEAGDWVSIGVFSTDSIGGPGVLNIMIGTYLYKVDSNGTPDETFNSNIVKFGGFNGYVYSIKSDSNGKIYVGGNIGGFNGTEIDGFVRLNSDGTLDEDFQNTRVYFSNNVNTIELYDDKILVGGQFDELYDPTTDGYYFVGYITRLNSDGSLDFTFNYDGFNFGDGFSNTYGVTAVSKIKLDFDNKILVCGDFNEYNSDFIGYGLARLNTNGTIDTTLQIENGFASQTVWDIALQSDGKIIVGGNIYYYDYDGGYTTLGIARIYPDGSPDLKFNTFFFDGEGFSAQIFSLDIDSNGNTIVGGAANFYDDSIAGYNVQIGNGGSVCRLFTFDNTPLNSFDTCDNDIKIFSSESSVLDIDNNKLIYSSANLSQNTLNLVVSGEDDDGNYSVELPLPFDLNFLGTNYTSLFIGTNSYITFGSGAGANGTVIPNEIPNNIGLPGVYLSTSTADGDCLDSTLFNLYTGMTDNGNTMIIKFEGNDDYAWDDFSVEPIINFSYELRIYKDVSNYFDIIIHKNEIFCNDDSTGGVSNGVDESWVVSFDTRSGKSYRLTQVSSTEMSVTPLNKVIKGNVNTNPYDCGVLNGGLSGFNQNSGAIYFSGDDYLYSNSSEDWSLGLEDFTIEWIQKRYVSTDVTIFALSDTIGVDIINDNTFSLILNGTSYYVQTETFDYEQFVHFAITKQNNIIRVFRNGVEQPINSDGGNFVYMESLENTSDNLQIGYYNYQFEGLITNFRWTKGVALYTSNFEAPSSVLLPIYDKTKTLLLANNSDNPLEDFTGNHTWENGAFPVDWDNVNGNLFDNTFKLWYTSGSQTYNGCTECQSTNYYNTTLLVRDGIKTFVIRRIMKPSDITKVLEGGPIFTITVNNTESIECFEILNYNK